MMEFFGQMMKLPFEAFVYSMDMLVKTMRGIQHIAYQGIDMMADGATSTLSEAPGAESDGASVAYEGTAATHDATDGSTGTSGNSAEVTPQTTQEEVRKMADTNLSDDMLKLVRYKILFVKRDYEHAFPEKEELVSENTDKAGYTAWKIAEFIQDLGNIEIPQKWQDKDYPRNVKGEIASPPNGSPKIESLPEDDKKYLRVYYEVMDRYERERFRYEERQIEVLEQIRDKMTS